MLKYDDLVGVLARQRPYINALYIPLRLAKSPPPDLFAGILDRFIKILENTNNLITGSQFSLYGVQSF